MTNLNNKKRILWITRTAVFIALLVVAQVSTAPLGNTLVTGSLVNMLLVVAVMTCGIPSGVCVAVVSPVFAKLLGIGPLWSLIPFIILGNVVLVLVWHLIGNRSFGGKYVPYIVALIVAALCKFVVLFVGITKLAVPIILQLPEPQAIAISGVFSVPQLATALIGGVLGMILIPIVKKIIKLQKI